MCAFTQAVAYGVRAQARIQHYGFGRSLASNGADLIVTMTAFSTGGVLNSSLKKLGTARATCSSLEEFSAQTRA